MFDFTIRLGDLLVVGGVAITGLKVATKFTTEVKTLHQTVFGSKEPPVEGLVVRVERLEKR